jgi:hypothetical protein
MVNQITLDILTLIPITFKQCMHCEQFYDQSGIGDKVHNQILSEYPQDLLNEQEQLITLVIELVNRFNDGIVIKFVDPQSIKGILLSIRHRVRRYPAFIINKKELLIGINKSALNQMLETAV